MIDCPVCHQQLDRRKSAAGFYWLCRQCRGRAVTVPVLRQTAGPVFAAHLWSLVRGHPNTTSRCCPSCRKPMVEIYPAVGNVCLTVDVCPRCQLVWFDPHEFQAIPKTRPVSDSVQPRELPPAAREALAMWEVERIGERAKSETDLEMDWRMIPGLLGLPVETEDAGKRTVPWLTWGLCSVILFFSLMILYAFPEGMDALALVPAEPFRMGGLTFATSFLLHAGLLHLFGNLYFLFVFGDNVEDTLGPTRFAMLLVLASLAGDVTHIFADPRSEVPLVGASGGISGVIAFYALRFPHARLGFLFRIGFHYFRWVNLPAWGAFLLWCGLQVYGAYEQILGFS
ncbi:MAG TPA: rhomboid family intramembrane serine protease, partial [Methylomirabilota bacterium]|nr:rhomboid family intramembrane serine protease [Methylomirabilota bacterium]